MAKTLADEYHGRKCGIQPFRIDFVSAYPSMDNEPNEWLTNAERKLREERRVNG